MKRYNKQYYAEHKDIIDQKHKDWFAEHPDFNKKYQKKWYIESEYYANNKKRFSEHYIKNKDILKTKRDAKGSMVYFDLFDKIGFKIYRITDDIFICAFGYAHLFNFPITLNKAIKRYSKAISQNTFNVYFDLSSVLGENASNRYFTVIFDKNQNDFVYATKTTLTNLPIK